MTQQVSVESGQKLRASERGGEAIGWNIALSVLVVGIAGLIWVHWDTAFAMYDLWITIHSYNHAFLILPVCGYLAWERFGSVRHLKPRSSWLGLLLVLAFGLLWLVADVVDVMAVRQAALVGMIDALVLATLGWRICMAMLFPLLYVWLAVPFDLGLLPPLQTMATAAAVWGIGLLDVPVFVEGFYIEIPSGRYWVAPGCAGLNFLLSGFALSLLYGEQMYDDWRKRVACVVIMIVIAIVANWMRIFALIGAGHFLGEVYDINDHYLEGWLFFAVIVFVMMWVGMRFRDPVRQAPKSEAVSASGAPLRPGVLAAYLAVALGSVAAGLAFPVYAAYRQASPPPAVAVHVAFPEKIGSWQRGGGPGDWQPQFAGADAQATARYTNGNKSIDLFVAYYERQGDGREMVAYNNRIFDNKIWHRQRRGGARAQIGGNAANVIESVLQSGSRRRLVWHIYWVDGQLVRSAVKTKLLQAKATLLFGDPRAGFIAAASPEEDKTALESFLRALPPIPQFVAPGP